MEMAKSKPQMLSYLTNKLIEIENGYVLVYLLDRWATICEMCLVFEIEIVKMS